MNTPLFTDFYQLTMAYGYWKSGMTDRESVFNLFFRRLPFKGGYCVSCGLEKAMEFIENFRFREDDLTYMRKLTGNDDRPLFEEGFLEYLKNMEFQCDLDAVPEGSVVFPQEPILRVKGPLVQCQLLESPLLNLINFSTLIATKAARIRQAAQEDRVLEFGLRRAQGTDGAMTASRAAYIGGCDSTSNLLAGKMFGIPVSGTIAHSWIMSFEDESEAFHAWAKAMPNNCVLLVDTYSTLEGTRKAVSAAETLKKTGLELSGIRLDSGDLAALSVEARKILDENGLTEVKIVASSDLDEIAIQRLKEKKARIDVWGVGTKLATAFDNPALDGVYKLSAIRRTGGDWKCKVKLSENPAKTTIPGIQQVRRYFDSENVFQGDVIYDVGTGIGQKRVMIAGPNSGSVETTPQIASKDLLKPVYRQGRMLYSSPSLEEIRNRVAKELASLPLDVKKNVGPHPYPVWIEKNLYDLKNDLIDAKRE